MKNTLFIFLFLMTNVSLFSQVKNLLVDTDGGRNCKEYINYSLIETYQADFQLEFFTRRSVEHDKIKKYGRFLEVLQDSILGPKLDSLFQLAKGHLIEHLGAENYCSKVRLDRNVFSRYSRGKSNYIIPFRFFYHSGDQLPQFSYVINFEISKNKDGQYAINYPKTLPECYVDDCWFELCNPKLVQMKAIEMDLIDPDDYIHIDYDDGIHASIELDALFLYRTIYLNLKTGELVKDSLGRIRRKDDSSLTDLIEKADFILDAKKYREEEFIDNNSGDVFTNYFYKIHAMIKGDYPDSIFMLTYRGGAGVHISHGEQVPIGRNLFLLKEDKDTLNKYYNYHNNPKYPAYKKLYNLCIPQNISSDDSRVYSKFYPQLGVKSLEDLSHFRPFVTRNISVEKWLKHSNQLHLKDSIGLISGLDYSQWVNENSKILTQFTFDSYYQTSFPHDIQYIVEYDTCFTGLYAAKNDKVTATILTNSEDHNPDEYQIGFTDDYLFTLSDANANTLQINIEHKSNQPYFGLNANKGKYYYYYKFDLIFDVQESCQDSVFSLRMDETKMQNMSTYIDVFDSGLKNYAFHFLQKKESHVNIKDKEPKIINYSSIGYQPYDTILIQGSQFNAHIEHIYYSYLASENTTAFYRLKRVPASNILSFKDHQIQCILPEDYENMPNIDQEIFIDYKFVIII